MHARLNAASGHASTVHRFIDLPASREPAAPFVPTLGVPLRRAALWLLIPGSLAAQASEGPERPGTPVDSAAEGAIPLERSIGDVFDRRDARLLPERLHDTVRIRGTIATPTRIARINSRWASALQDQRGGVMLVDSTDILGPLDRGTHLEIVGTVQSFNGSEELNVLSAIRLGAEFVPAPLSVGPMVLNGEALAGRMVSVRGRLRLDEREGAGAWMYLEDEGDRVQLYFPLGVRTSPLFALSIADAGRLVEIDGIAGQYDRTPPYDSDYQLIVLDPTAVRMLGVAPVSVKRWAVGGSAAVLALVLAGVYLGHQRRLRALRQLSSNDPMTGLLNRRGYEHAVQQALEQRRPPGSVVALILLDLDDFKLINDQYGHLTGDAVLREVAVRLRELVPPEAGMVSRFGGDEFAIVLPDSSGASAAALANRIVRRLRTLRVTAPTAETGPLSLTCGASVGVATTEDAPDQITADALLHDADTALYAGKRAGKGRAEMARRLA